MTKQLWTGELLRAARENQGVSIKSLSELTRIRGALLTAIENDDFHFLPAEAYTKGFLVQIARQLTLPEGEVADTYFSRDDENSKSSQKLSSHIFKDDTLAS